MATIRTATGALPPAVAGVKPSGAGKQRGGRRKARPFSFTEVRMTTFLELIKANGFESIEDYLDSISGIPVPNDLPQSMIEKIRENEARTEQYLGGKAC